MDRAKAQRLLEKLEAVTEARGATAGEARSAAAKARGLRQRFDLHAAPKSESRRRRSGSQRGAPFSRVRVVDDFGSVWQPGGPISGFDPPQEWDFNVQTGEASSNVKVKHHNGPGDWSIEIPFP